MPLILPALDVAFAAFCVWLTVRIVNRKERWAKRLALWLIVLLPTLYVLSSGPLIQLAFWRERVGTPTAEHIGFQDDGQYQEEIMLIGRHEWWENAYAPLKWMAQESWGAPLRWYWQLFPIPYKLTPN